MKGQLRGQKTLNTLLYVGAEAERRRMVRGDILLDEGKNQRIEKTTFHGEHLVEVYVIKGGVCVARDLIDVPISENI